jgi:twitching motility protein PilU
VRLMNLKALLKLMVEKKASDLFLTSNAPVKIKIEGRILSVNKQDLQADAVRQAALSIMSAEQMDLFTKDLELDFAISEPGLGRFRVNAFHQRGEVAMTLRYITTDIPRLDELGLPSVLKDLALRKRGLLLMVGATGSGKSTTLAAMVDHRNESTADHILTIEDPIEYVHSNKNSIINQREVGGDTHSYGRALRSAMREAPDVIQIGEIRDRDTMEAVLALAGTGHLAISTLHANNAAETLDRIVNMFPAIQHPQVLLDLSQYLLAIISQRLIKSRSGRRLAAVEVLINTPHVSQLIGKGDVAGVKEALAESREPGMQSFDGALFEIYKQGRIDQQEALANAESRTNLEARINFG